MHNPPTRAVRVWRPQYSYGYGYTSLEGAQIKPSQIGLKTVAGEQQSETDSSHAVLEIQASESHTSSDFPLHDTLSDAADMHTEHPPCHGLPLHHPVFLRRMSPG